MPLSLKEVEHIATLARLELTSEEKARYRQQLSAILDYVARLQELDTTSIQPTASVLAEDGVLRPDQPVHGLNRDDILGNAAQTREDQFLIPPVFDHS